MPGLCIVVPKLHFNDDPACAQEFRDTLRDQMIHPQDMSLAASKAARSLKYRLLKAGRAALSRSFYEKCRSQADQKAYFQLQVEEGIMMT